MKELTRQERLDLWRYVYSRSSFLEARAAAQFLLRDQHGLEHYYRVALLTALVIAYARPFSCAQIDRTRRVIPMADVPVPDRYKDLHETLLEMRHQVFGHKDATRPVLESGVLNEVHFVRKGDYVDVHTVLPGSYEEADLRATCQLIDDLVAKLDAKINTLVESHPLPIAGEGVYRLNLDESKKPWIEKVHDG